MTGPAATLASTSPILFFAAFTAAFLLYWVFCVRGRLRWTLPRILAVGLLIRAALLPLAPSDDIARYAWEGRMILAGINPYLLAPADKALAAFRDADGDGAEDAAFTGINHPEHPAIYPPLALGLFAGLAALSPSPLLFKAFFILLDAAGLALLALAYRRAGGRSRETQGALPGPKDMPLEDAGRMAAIYFLNPLLMLEGAGHGHYEALPLLFSLAFLLALRRGKVAWAAGALLAGASAKVAALALLPALWSAMAFPGGQGRLDRRGALLGTVLGAGVMLALAALLHAVGSLANLGRFATDFRHNDLIPWLLRFSLGDMVPSTALGMLSALLLAAAGFALLAGLRKAGHERRCLLFMALLLAFSPTVHPWYVLWLLPFAAPLGSRPFLLLTGTLAAGYGVEAKAGVTGKWREIPWLRIPEYLPPALLWVKESLRRPTPEDPRKDQVPGKAIVGTAAPADQAPPDGGKPA